MRWWIPLLSAGTGDDNPCRTALEQPVERARPVKKTPAEPGDAIEDWLDGVLGIFD